MPLAGDGAKVQIDFESRVDELIADTNRVIQQQEKLKQETKETNAALKKSAQDSENAAKKGTMSWTEFRSAYSTMLDVVRVGKQVWEETAGATFKYDEEVRKLAEVSGTGAEEASRLLQVMDDFKLTADDVFLATKALTKNGLSPTIETLASLSDQYRAIQDPQQKAAFLMDNFGKSGLKFAEAMSKGGDALKQMGLEVEKSLIRTDAQIAKTRLAELAFDKYSDKIQALKIEVGTSLIGAVDGSNYAIQKQAETFYTAATGADYLKDQMFGLTDTQKAAWEEANRLANEQYLLSQGIDLTSDAVIGETLSMEELADEAKIAEQAIKDITKANEDFLKLTDDLTKSQESYKEKMSDLTTQHEELLAEKQTLIDQGYSVEGQAILDVNAKIDENMAKQDEATAAFELDGRRRILSMLEQQLAVGGLSTAETAYLLDLGLQWGVYSEEAVNAANAAQTEVNNFVAAFAAIPTEKDVTIRVATIQSTYAADNGAGFDAAHPNGHATGGEFMIPQSYGNEGFRMGNNDTASGGEMVKITPKGQSPNDNSPQNTTAVISDASMDKFIARIETALQRAGK